MCRHHLVLLTSLLLSSSLLPTTLLQAQDSEPIAEKQAGTAPRASATKYRAHAEKDGFSVGAELLRKKQAFDVFAADVNRCCLVVHVAVYPNKDDLIDISLMDFMLVAVDTEWRVRPESALVVAAKLEKKKIPPAVWTSRPAAATAMNPALTSIPSPGSRSMCTA